MKRRSLITNTLLRTAGGLALLAPSLAAHVGLNAPDGGETLCAGTTYRIEWQVLASHDLQNWDLSYSTSGPGGPFVPIATDLPAGDDSSGSIHTYDWTIPDTPSTQVFVRVVQDNSETDYEDVKAVPVIEGPASVAFRNGGTNPITYAASAAVLGGTFTASVDNASVGQTMSVLFAFEDPVSITLGPGQTVLCLGTEEMFTGAGLFPSGGGGGIDTFSASVPVDCCGLRLYSQAIQLGSSPFVLSNAQDLVLGGI